MVSSSARVVTPLRSLLPLLVHWILLFARLGLLLFSLFIMPPHRRRRGGVITWKRDLMPCNMRYVDTIGRVAQDIEGDFSLYEMVTIVIGDEGGPISDILRLSEADVDAPNPSPSCNDGDRNSGLHSLRHILAR